MWSVEFTDEFGEWWTGVEESVQDAVDRSVRILERVGPSLGRPHVDTIQASRHAHMKELRVQCGGDPYRIFFCFDPRRAVILLIGGCKRGDGLFYDRMIPVADRLYETYLAELRKEGLI